MLEPLLPHELPDDAVYRNLLATQGWLFIAPLVLVRFTPGRLIGPAVWGLVTMLGPAVGR
ncbi:unnamed protein product [Durusdinium trenchii]|uniref:Uncharacterized protein n=1 Tax=Durusdinium trenchii TaxID=1381693 RepID=A0ABP0RGR4_9DINO